MTTCLAIIVAGGKCLGQNGYPDSIRHKGKANLTFVQEIFW
jgi:hypothetical protein